MPTTPRIYLDSSVIIAAVFSAEGGARKIFRLGEIGMLRLVIGGHVLRECDAVVRRKAAASLPGLARLLEQGKVELLATAADDLVTSAREVVAYPPDAYVLAEALAANVGWFITHDKAHFLKSRSTADLPFWIATPGDLLQSLSENFGSSV